MRKHISSSSIIFLCLHATGAWGDVGGETLDVPVLPPPTPATAEPLVTFFFEPSASVEYNDNVLRSVDGAERDDLIFVIAPQFRAALTGDEIRGEATVGLELGRYLDVTENDYLDGALRMRGRWSPNEMTGVHADFGVRRDHSEINEATGDIDFAADEVTKFYEVRSIIGFDRRFDRFTVEASGGATYLDYDRFTSQSGGQPPIFNNDRDRLEIGGSARMTWSAEPGIGLFGELVGDRRGYFDELEGQGFKRSSVGYGGFVGLDYAPPGEDVSAEIGVGALGREFDAGAFGSELTPAVRAEMRYRPIDEQITIGARIISDIKETNLDSASSFTSHRGEIDAAYNVTEVWSVIGGGSLEHRDFDIDGDEREDVILRGEIGVRREIRDATFLNLTVGYDRRFSDSPSARYDAVTVSTGVSVSF